MKRIMQDWFRLIVLAICVSTVTLSNGQSSCGQFDYVQESIPDVKSDSQQHVWGDHAASTQGYTECYYSGNPGEQCNVNMLARGDILSTKTESGAITVYEHNVELGYYDGGANGASPQSATEVTAVGVRSCLTPLCSFTISVAFPPVTVSYTPSSSSIWGYQDTEAFACQSEVGAQCQPQQCPPKYIWDPVLCACEYVGGSPIIIDTRHVGFKLSKPVKGTCAPFDLKGDGETPCWSWPVVGSGNGWLVLPYRTHPNDRHNPALAVASGKDMFGNYTEQPESKNKNGYDALMQFALVQNGGFINPDGSPNYILDQRDAVWEKLRIWIPEDYSGIPKPRELHKLSEFGIHSIGLIPAAYTKADEWGNTFRFGAPLNIAAGEARDWHMKNDSRLSAVNPHELDVQTYDVWLVHSESK
jgi:hypothetical protein